LGEIDSAVISVNREKVGNPGGKQLNRGKKGHGVIDRNFQAKLVLEKQSLKGGQNAQKRR